MCVCFVNYMFRYFKLWEIIYIIYVTLCAISGSGSRIKIYCVYGSETKAIFHMEL